MTNAPNDLAAAEQHRTAGRLGEAQAICERLLEGDPRDPDTLSLLGTIQCERGDFSQATASIGRAIRVRPKNALLHRQLGDIHFLAGEMDRSIECYHHAIGLDSEDSQIRNNLGVALRQAGKLNDAIAAFEDALQLRPDLPLPHKNLGEVYCIQGKMALALTQYETALRIDPRDATTLNSIGIILSMQGKQAEAITRFEDALTLEPNFAKVENNLAGVLATVGRFDEAITHARNALRLRPQFANGHITMGNILKLQGKNEQAVEEYKQALELDPCHTVAHQSLGSVLTDLGKFDLAIIHLEETLQLDPNHFTAYQNLVALAVQDKYQLSAEQHDRIKALLGSKNLSPAHASQLHFMMGSILNKQQDYDAAMRAFQQANALQMGLLSAAGSAFDANQFGKEIDETISVFQPALFENEERGGLDSDVPVFVVGMPRSGTTLVEQIIASHPQAAGVGELPDIATLVEELSILGGGETAYPKCILHADSGHISELAQRYLERLEELAPGASRIVDKLPGNFLYLGFIAIAFPNARVIHCRRNAMDVCLSCYLSDFGALQWAWRLEDIGFYHYQYQRLMNHWHQILPLQMYDVDYEQLVADHEAVSRDLISFCGLDWNDQCLKFHNSDRAVQTLSRVQVRQPIYNTSIGRWKHYEKYLDPLVDALKGTNNEK